MMVGADCRKVKLTIYVERLIDSPETVLPGRGWLVVYAWHGMLALTVDPCGRCDDVK